MNPYFTNENDNVRISDGRSIFEQVITTERDGSETTVTQRWGRKGAVDVVYERYRFAMRKGGPEWLDKIYLADNPDLKNLLNSGDLMERQRGYSQLIRKFGAECIASVCEVLTKEKGDEMFNHHFVTLYQGYP